MNLPISVLRQRMPEGPAVETRLGWAGGKRRADAPEAALRDAQTECSRHNALWLRWRRERRTGGLLPVSALRQGKPEAHGILKPV